VLEPLGLVRIAGGGRSVALELTDGAAAVAGIVELLRGIAVVPATITVARPTLDDVFLRYTGSTISEHDEPLEPARRR
jgi:ABC-2 type transport system ATP-binding protein